MKNIITKALVNADALDQKLSAAKTQNEAMQTNIKRITCLDHAGREVSCAIVQRQAHETSQILDKALADVERLEMTACALRRTQRHRARQCFNSI